MRTISRQWIAAGLLAAFTAAVHVFAGTPEVMPTLRAVPPAVGLLLLACWHLASVTLAASAAALLWSARCAARAEARVLARWVATIWLLFALVFLAVAIAHWGWDGIAVLPQWVLLLPVGVLALSGARRAGAARRLSPQPTVALAAHGGLDAATARPPGCPHEYRDPDSQA